MTAICLTIGGAMLALGGMMWDIRVRGWRLHYAPAIVVGGLGILLCCGSAIWSGVAKLNVDVGALTVEGLASAVEPGRSRFEPPASSVEGPLSRFEPVYLSAVSDDSLYHFQGCRYEKQLAEHYKREYPSAEAARAAGHSPCQWCERGP
jgi:hypothetical protein